MFKKERQREILRFVENRGKAGVEALSRHLHVSEMTIRRDLVELDAQGLLERVHGGALLQHDAAIDAEPPVVDRTSERSDAKQRIGQHIAKSIRDGEKIFLGSGSTTAAVAEALLHHHNLTVVTNERK